MMRGSSVEKCVLILKNKREHVQVMRKSRLLLPIGPLGILVVTWLFPVENTAAQKLVSSPTSLIHLPSHHLQRRMPERMPIALCRDFYPSGVVSLKPTSNTPRDGKGISPVYHVPCHPTKVVRWIACIWVPAISHCSPGESEWMNKW